MGYVKLSKKRNQRRHATVCPILLVSRLSSVVMLLRLVSLEGVHPKQLVSTTPAPKLIANPLEQQSNSPRETLAAMFASHLRLVLDRLPQQRLVF
jgi:hypothetical protein